MIKPAVLAATLLTLAAAPVAAQPPAGGGMTLAQMRERLHARFNAADANHDGRLTAAERQQAMEARRAGMAARAGEGGGMPGPGPRRGGPMGRMADANGDITLAALDAGLAQRFARLDANHDGRITPDERPARRIGPDGPGRPGGPDAPGL